VTDDFYDIHPLDRDYSQPIVRPARKLSQEQKLQRFGLATFIVGFLLVVAAAILTNSFPKVMWIESLSSGIHRLAMLTILAGGVILLVSFRYHEIEGARKSNSQRNQRRTSQGRPARIDSSRDEPDRLRRTSEQPQLGDYGNFTPITDDEFE